MSETTATVKYRKDYAPTGYCIDQVQLDFYLDDDHVIVTAELDISRRADSDATELFLDGEDLELQEIFIDGTALDATQYQLSDEGLLLKDLPDGFALKTVVKIRPHLNTQLSGLYQSGSMFCTQCEALGFRRITYYLDRPDVMTTFVVRLSADKVAYPVLLSNGNLVNSGDLEGGRHFAEWHDPHPKPSYLFALVAGDLGVLHDTFTTCSGKLVDLYVYSEHENANKLSYAMQSLIESMKWDEEVYGFEYDLEIFNIVAVGDFNMGAMENKSLNVFNTAYVLASPETATDSDYEGIEGVIGHEYFHNYTGNRITCRDWFQLTLKEGLTVFRDQQFSADQGDAALKRIDDVNVLRSVQFREDMGPMAHPIRPESYVAMDNFYTSTVYNKGAEVIRMMHTLVGVDGFRRGTDLYLERYDGQAVSCDDFRLTIADANSRDFSQFELWYSQAGTPKLSLSTSYDTSTQRFILHCEQSCKPTPKQDEKLPFHIPLLTALLDKEGNELATERVLELTAAKQDFVFENIAVEPVVSVLRQFSAPVTIDFEQSDRDLQVLMSFDSDTFNRWEAGQRFATRVIFQLMDELARGEAAVPNNDFLDSVANIANDDVLSPGMKSYLLCLPGHAALSGQLDVVDPDLLHNARKILRVAIADRLQEKFIELYTLLASDEVYEPSQQQIGRRRLRNVCLSYLSVATAGDGAELCASQFAAASNMTDSIAALACLANLDVPQRQTALSEFFEKWENEDLVVDKWLSVQASSTAPDTLARVVALKEHHAFDIRNPNKVRSLIRTFAANPVHFHSADGEGYRFVADCVIELDKLNPQIAARIAGAFAQWHRYESSRSALMKEQLQRISQQDKLSPNTFEIVKLSLQA
ncbi:MAG TPA: aminopeptidase N [Planctomycetes bacterium]|nr:aminopeptidase N [Planctomycetota bacterium]